MTTMPRLACGDDGSIDNPGKLSFDQPINRTSPSPRSAGFWPISSNRRTFNIPAGGFDLLMGVASRWRDQRGVSASDGKNACQ